MEVEFPEQMKCPICFEVPEKEIFQCKNGHTICDVCCESVSLCPQCRVNFGNGNKIRNRALEELLDMIKYHCSFKDEGYVEKIARRDITRHYETCEFGGKSAAFCRYLGFDCKFKINTRKLQTSYSHLLDSHRVISTKGNFIEARFSKFSDLDRNLKILWRPIILNAYNENLIVVASYQADNLAVASFSLNELSNFLIEFRFESKLRNLPDIRWITEPIYFMQAKNIIRFPPHMTSVNLLHEGYLENHQLVLHVFVHGDRFPCKTFQTMQIVDMHVSLKSQSSNLPTQNQVTSSTTTSSHGNSPHLNRTGENRSKEERGRVYNDVLVWVAFVTFDYMSVYPNDKKRLTYSVVLQKEALQAMDSFHFIRMQRRRSVEQDRT